MNTEDYRNHIDRAIREESSETILNGSHTHATIIIERMFAHARDCVHLMTRRFDPRIYGTSETVEQAKLFLGESDRVCRILIEEIDDLAFATHPFVEALSENIQAGNLEIRQVPKSLADIIKFNYALMDDRGFRFEEDKREAVAVAAFGPETARFVESLKRIFDKTWAQSSKVSPEQRAAVAH